MLQVRLTELRWKEFSYSVKLQSCLLIWSCRACLWVAKALAYLRPVDTEQSVRGWLVDHHLVDRPTGQLSTRRPSTGRKGYKFSQLVDRANWSKGPTGRPARLSLPEASHRRDGGRPVTPAPNNLFTVVHQSINYERKKWDRMSPEKRGISLSKVFWESMHLPGMH